jgi:hypothetical protein
MRSLERLEWDEDIEVNLWSRLQDAIGCGVLKRGYEEGTSLCMIYCMCMYGFASIKVCAWTYRGIQRLRPEILIQQVS